MNFAEILIVDDEKSILNALKRELRSKVAKIHTAKNGTQALTILDVHHIDLIITDYSMPHMTGTELLLEVKRLHPDVPGIMLSGKADLSGVISAINQGILNKFVEKPWDANKLASMINAALNHDSKKDRLTKMATRRELDLRLAILPEENEHPWLLVIVEILDLNTYNTTYGKVSGNELIQKIAAAIRHCTELIWYRAGDKFMTLIKFSAEGYQTIDAFSVRINEVCVAYTNDVTMRCYVSEAKNWRGWSKQQFSASKKTAMHIYDLVYWLVQNGNQTIADEYNELGTLIRDLDLGRMEAFFQPQLTLHNGDIAHCEALARRSLPDNTYEQPSKFLYLIHKYELDDVLTTLMIRHAVEILRRLGTQRQLTVSVNVTSTQLISGFIQAVLRKINPNDVFDLSRIEVEVVESSPIFDYQRALSQFHQLHELGVTIAMDDFGTGYSGFESLCDLPFDVVKIDGRFVRALGNSLSDDVILSAITNSAKSLNIEVVAEMVENTRQAEYFKRKGCTRIQGNLVSPPLPMDDFLYFLDNHVAGI